MKSEQIYKNIKNIKIKQEEEKIPVKNEREASQDNVRLVSSNESNAAAIVK